MTDEVENHTLRLLQEMRAEMREGQAEMRDELAATRTELAGTRTEMREGFAEVRQRLSTVEGSLGKVIDAVTEIAKIQEKHSGLLIELAESYRRAKKLTPVASVRFPGEGGCDSLSPSIRMEGT